MKEKVLNIVLVDGQLFSARVEKRTVYPRQWAGEKVGIVSCMKNKLPVYELPVRDNVGGRVITDEVLEKIKVASKTGAYYHICQGDVHINANTVESRIDYAYYFKDGITIERDPNYVPPEAKK